MEDTNMLMEFRLRNIPDEIFYRLKAMSALERKSLNAKILELIEQEVERFDNSKQS